MIHSRKKFSAIIRGDRFSNARSCAGEICFIIFITRLQSEPVEQRSLPTFQMALKSPCHLSQKNRPGSQSKLRVCRQCSSIQKMIRASLSAQHLKLIPAKPAFYAGERKYSCKK
jgi:hypothetical protein